MLYICCIFCRPPSPQPRRAYRTPIALQTRGIASTAGLAFVPGIGLMQRGGSVGGTGVSNATNAGNVVASILNDLAMLGGAGTAGVAGSQQQPGRAQTGTTATAAPAPAPAGGRPGGPGSRGPAPPSNRHVDIHIAFLQPQLSGSNTSR